MVNKLWRKRSFLLSLFCSIGLAFLYWKAFISPATLSTVHHDDIPITPATDSKQPPKLANPIEPSLDEQATFWRALMSAVIKGRPSFDRISKTSDAAWLTYDPAHLTTERPDKLDIPQEQIEELKRIRKQAITDMQAIAHLLPFVKGSKGIVLTATNMAFPVQAVSLYMLRQTGSTLPVEFWIWNEDEYEETICTKVFPQMGATCRIMSRIYPKDLPQPYEEGIESRFIFKILALLFSSFDKLIFMDCDVFPVLNVDDLLDSEPFLSKNWVFWPDKWANTASKYWFEIAEQPVLPMRERAATESGQLLLQKSTHGAALLMAYFYNYYGQRYFYPLWSQGAIGQGDKESFLPAAQDFGLSWHQVRQPPHIVGYTCDGNRIQTAFGHSHPFDDARREHEPRLVFIHHHAPKLDVHAMLDADPVLFRCIGASRPHRLWDVGDPQIKHLEGDVERRLWQGMTQLACRHQKDFRVWSEPSWYRPNPRTDLCERITELSNDLFG